MAADVKIFPDRAALGRAAADWFEAVVAENPGRIAICLTGGSTAETLYGLLASRPLPWQRMHFFWSDERFVPLGDPRNNAAIARRLLLEKVPVPAAHIHPMPVSVAGNQESAARYDAELKRFYGADVLDPARPLFDLVLNGMGYDGHTASLFPGQPTLEERTRWCIAAEPKHDPFVPRMTLTFPALESCRASGFFVTGAGKAERLKQVLAGADFPAARIKPKGRLTWFVDRAAAGLTQ
jgi:6-phosphogluconolactonase